MTNRITPEPSRRDTPRRDPNVLFVECMDANTSQQFIVYSPTIQGMEMHWLPSEKRTVPCFEDTTLCPGGHKEDTVKWRAYVHCFSLRKKEPVFVQLTWEAWKTWMNQLREGVSLRGQHIIVHRTEKKNGRLWVEVQEYKSDRTGKMPPPLDCKLSCYRMWKFNPLEAQKNARLAPGREISKNGSFLP